MTKRFVLCALLLAGIVSVVPQYAAADNLTYTPTPVGVGQTQNNPCVIGDPSCDASLASQFVLTYTSSSGPCSGGNCNFTSPLYVAGANGPAAPLTIPLSFSIGVDENFAAGQSNEVLTLFQLLMCNSAGNNCTVVDSTTGPNTLIDENNGNGHTDGILSGFSTLTAGSHYKFQATWTNDTDGMEQFWIIPGTPTPSPEPASLALLGIGAVGLSGLVRRRSNRQ